LMDLKLANSSIDLEGAQVLLGVVLQVEPLGRLAIPAGDVKEHFSTWAFDLVG